MDEVHQFDDDYAPLQPQAILALLLGIASVLTFLGPVLLVLPAAAVGLALIALWKIRSSDGARKGAGMAKLGASLGVLFAAAAIVRGVVNESLIRRQTTQVAQKWVDLLAEEELQQALDLVTPGQIGRMGPRRDPNLPPLTAEEQRDLAVESLTSDELFLRLRSAETPVPLAVLTWAERPIYERLLTRYSGEFRAEVGDGEASFWLYFVRAKQFELTGSAWRIEAWQLNQ